MWVSLFGTHNNNLCSLKRSVLPYWRLACFSSQTGCMLTPNAVALDRGKILKLKCSRKQLRDTHKQGSGCVHILPDSGEKARTLQRNEEHRTHGNTQQQRGRATITRVDPGLLVGVCFDNRRAGLALESAAYHCGHTDLCNGGPPRSALGHPASAGDPQSCCCFSASLRAGDGVQGRSIAGEASWR